MKLSSNFITLITRIRFTRPCPQLNFLSNPKSEIIGAIGTSLIKCAEMAQVRSSDCSLDKMSEN